MTKTSDSTPRAYHHGELPRALLQALGEVLAERGAEALSLREVARRAGVSHGAPAHHFGDLQGMLAAYARQAFEALGEALRVACPADAAPRAQLKALGMAYVEFAVAQPARYRLMFRMLRAAVADQALQEAAQASFARLAKCIAALRGTAVTLDARDPSVMLAWSAVHGFANLLLEGLPLSLSETGGPWRDLLDASLELLVPALAAQQPE